jgi:sulfatase maturation enzyme AslB (radical SAM superfamily)
MARFCHAPWVQVNVFADGAYAPCCTMGMGDNKQYTYIDYITSTGLKELKDDFRNGIEPAACKHCWEHEKTGSWSTRQSVEHAVAESGLAVDISDVISPFYSIQIATSQVCNLKCRICRPASSSKLVKEHNDIIAMGHRQGQEKWTIPIKRFLGKWGSVDWIKENNQNLEHFQMLGGEPFADLVGEQIELLASFEHPENINLTMVTNGTLMPPPAMLEIWKKFKRVLLVLSIDGTGDTFEYGRFPANWKQVESNVFAYKQLCVDFPNIEYKLNNTVSMINVLNLPAFVQWTKDNDIIAPIGVLVDPPHYNFCNQADEIKQYIIQALEPVSHLFPDIVRQLTISSAPVKTKEFMVEIELLDSVRKQSYKEVYPADFVALLEKYRT